MVNYWLAKQEPSGPRGYHILDLKKDKTTVWDGIHNNQALKFMRNAKKGDENFFKLPEPIINKAGCNLSFAGLKTAVLRETKKINGNEKLKYEIDIGWVVAGKADPIFWIKKFATAIANTTSVPGFGLKCMCARLAVLVFTGSITINVAPLFIA